MRPVRVDRFTPRQGPYDAVLRDIEQRNAIKAMRESWARQAQEAKRQMREYRMRQLAAEQLGGGGPLGFVDRAVGSAWDKVSRVPVVNPVWLAHLPAIETARAAGLDLPPAFDRTLTLRKAPEAAMTSVIPRPGLRAIGGIPYVGEHTRRFTEGLTSPVGLASLGAGGAGIGGVRTAAGLAGSFALGGAGRVVETQLGVEPVETPVGAVGPRAVGEVAGGFWEGGGVRQLAQRRLAAYGRGIAETAPSALAASGRAGLDLFGAAPLQPQAAGRRPAAAAAAQAATTPQSPAVRRARPRAAATIQTLTAPPSEQPAITLWRRWQGQLQAEGDEALVRFRDLESEARRIGIPLSNKRTPAMETLMAALHYDAPIDSLPKAWQEWARRVRQVLAEEEAATLAAVPSFERRLRPEYFPQFFRPSGRSGGLGKLRLGQKPGFTRRRKLEGTLAEIFAKHPELDLRTWNPLEMAYARVVQGIRWRANELQLERLKALGLARPKSQAPADWVVPREAPAFQPRPVPGEPEVFSPPWAVPREVADVLDDQFGSSGFSLSAPLRIVRGGVAAAKQAKTFGGLFQHFDYTLRLLGLGTGKFRPQLIPAAARALARGFVPDIDRRMLRFDVEDPIRSALLREGIQVQGGLDILESQLRETLQDPGFFVRTGLSDNVVSRRIKGALDYIGSATYLRAHREYVLSAGETWTRHFMEQGDPLELAAAKAARLVNEQFSSLPAWQSIFRSPTTRDLMRLSLFSPNETEAWWRNFFRMASGPHRREAARFYLGIIATTAGIANVLNFMATGEPLPPERYLPVRKDPDGDFQFNTTFLRPTAPWKGPMGRQEFIDILGQADTPLRWIQFSSEFPYADPLEGFRSKLGQLPGATLQLIKGERYFGSDIEGPGDTARFLAEQVLPIPATGFLEERGRIGLTGSLVQTAGVNISAESLYATRNRMRDTVAEELYGAPYDALNDAQQAKVNADSRVAELDAAARGESIKDETEYGRLLARRAEREQLVQAFQETGRIGESAFMPEGILEYDRAFTAGEIDLDTWLQYDRQYRDGLRALNAALRIGEQPYEAQAPENSVDGAIARYFGIAPADYYDPQTKVVDWDAYFAARDEAKAEAVRLGGQDVADYLDRADERPLKREQEEAYRLYDQAPEKYAGVKPGESETIDAFLEEVQKVRAQGVPQPDGSYAQVPGKYIADYLAEQRGDPALALWYRALTSDYEGLLNPAYNTYLRRHYDTLGRWLPWLYDSLAERTRLGLAETETFEYGPPRRPSRPQAPTARERAEEAWARRVLEQSGLR